MSPLSFFSSTLLGTSSRCLRALSSLLLPLALPSSTSLFPYFVAHRCKRRQDATEANTKRNEGDKEGNVHSSGGRLDPLSLASHQPLYFSPPLLLLLFFTSLPVSFFLSQMHRFDHFGLAGLSRHDAIFFFVNDRRSTCNARASSSPSVQPWDGFERTSLLEVWRMQVR